MVQQPKKAGPCGKITFDDYLKPSHNYATTTDTPIVTFDGSPLTTYAWKTEDDPVMGGKSSSTLIQQKGSGFGRWYGHVAIVPFLKSPGFCTIRTTSSSHNQFPDVTGTTKLKMMARLNATSELDHFNLQIQTKGGVSHGMHGTYSGNITVPKTGKWVQVEAEWSDFIFQWRGEHVKGPTLSTQLDQLTQIGVSTYFPGKVGKFDIEIKEFSAGN